MILVVPLTYLDLIMEGIAQATHGLTDINGDKRMVSTIDGRQLRTAALLALSIATGETIVAGDERIMVRRQRQVAGILSMEDR
jgi:hypothetical protein